MVDEIWKRPVYQSTQFMTELRHSHKIRPPRFLRSFFPNPEFRYRYLEPKVIAAKPFRTLAQDAHGKPLLASPPSPFMASTADRPPIQSWVSPKCSRSVLSERPVLGSLASRPDWLAFSVTSPAHALKWRLFVSDECPTAAVKCREIEMVNSHTTCDCGFRVLRLHHSAARKKKKSPMNM
jgi:hypothetical protein